MDQAALTAMFDQMEAGVKSAREDAEKAYQGNKAAGRRSRKTMQEVRKTAQAIRKQLLAGMKTTTNG